MPTVIKPQNRTGMHSISIRPDDSERLRPSRLMQLRSCAFPQLTGHFVKRKWSAARVTIWHYGTSLSPITAALDFPLRGRRIRVKFGRQAPSIYNFVINAKTQDLEVPPTMLAIAEEVIE